MDSRGTGKKVSKQEKRKKLRKRILLVLFILLNVGVIAWTALSEFASGDDAAKFEDVQLKWWMIIPAALMFILAAVVEIYKYYMVMRDSHSQPEKATKKDMWKIAQRTVLLGRYYDNITPAAIGGQPFQIYYMIKSGVRNGYGAVVPLIGMITDQLGALIVGVLAIVIGGLTNAIWSPAVVAVGWIGILFYAFFPIVILAATFLPKTTEEIIAIIIRFLHKIHIIKDADKAIESANKNIKQYADGIKVVLKTKGLFFKALIQGIIYYMALTSIPFFVLRAFGASVGWFPCFATTAAVSAAVYFIPTPGNAGAAEGTFFSVFSVLPQAGYVFWAMLFWRLFVYYGWLAIGGLTQLKIYFEDKTVMKNWGKGVDKVEESIGKTLKEADAQLKKDEKRKNKDRAEVEKLKAEHRAETEKLEEEHRAEVEKLKEEQKKKRNV